MTMTAAEKSIVVIDGQGGRMGAAVVRLLCEKLPDAETTAVGTNTIATSAMLKAGAKNGATGENAVVVACRKADIIVGPVGIVIADALFGEVTPVMAAAVAQSPAVRVLMPLNKCETVVVGVKNLPLAELAEVAVAQIAELLK